MMKKQYVRSFLVCLGILVCSFPLISCTNNGQWMGAASSDHIHAFGEWEITKSSSCTEVGEKVRHCPCGDMQTAVIAMAEHIGIVDNAVASSCTAAGLTEGRHCRVCGAVILAQKIVEAKGHVWGNPTCTMPRFCLECLEPDPDSVPPGHTYVRGECVLCGESAEKIINVPGICQYPDLPTGCEAVAATMVLQYYGEKITADEFASDWLICSNDFYSSGGKRYGPDPNECFVGDPFSQSSYGCYAAPIVSAINRNAKGCGAEKLENVSLEEICKDYIDQNKPVLIWATMGMKPSSAGNSWYLDDDSKFTWISGEHCLVLVGYNEKYYFFNDPQSGGTVAYQKDLVHERFEELGAQAVYIYTK